MALAQSGVRIGQAVVISYGGKTPYLLQRAGSRGYRFVGECYVHGLVHGEAFTEPMPENGSLQFGKLGAYIIWKTSQSMHDKGFQAEGGIL